MSWAGRNRGSLLIAAGLVVATLVSAWVSNGGVQYADRLDPQNPDPDGARAMAQVLGDQGVDLEIVRSADDLDAADLEGTTVLVTSAEQLGRSTARRLGELTGPRAVLVVEPSIELARLLGSEASPTPVRPVGRVAAQCADTRLTGLDVEVDSADSYPPVDSACFPAPDGGVLYAPQDDRLAFLGAGDALSNGQVTRADNAAAGLRLLGQDDRLVWYVPSLADLQSGDEVGVGALLPRWLKPGLWLGALVLLALVLWRGRRLGPLVTEPLPVVVKAIETTQSRGRLYRKARDRQHAAAALRTAARGRAADRLRMPRNGDERQLLEDVARHTGRALYEVSVLLSHHAPAPASDPDLTALARHLADLDEQLRKAPR